MTWDEVCEHPSLQDLPFKIETNRYGEIIMSPTKSRHGVFQGVIAGLLAQLLPNGIVSAELSLETSDGVKVPDVAWSSAEYYARHKDEDVFTESPEIVVEVLSESNTRPQMREKMELFFGRNAHEVWLVEPDGRMRFFTGLEEEVERSTICPDFPARIEPGVVR